MHPQAQLELQAVADGLLADEAQSFEIAIALGVRQVRGADVVAWHGEEEGVGEQKVGVGDSAQEIVADAEAEVEAVEPVFREHGEVMRPHLAVVKPGLVLDLAGEQALHAAYGVGGRLRAGLRKGGCAGQCGGSQEKIAALHKRIVLLIENHSLDNEPVHGRTCDERMLIEQVTVLANNIASLGLMWVINGNLNRTSYRKP